MTEEQYFEPFRKNTVGFDATYRSPYGTVEMIYTDWIGSGRLYRPIEDILVQQFGPYIANTHTETSESGKLMTLSYRHAHTRIKQLVHANEHDVILTTGTGMTGAVVKFQRILGLKNCAEMYGQPCYKESERPVVFITHMEHHSNHTSWYETMADVVVIDPGEGLLVNLDHLEELLHHYRHRKFKIGSFSACSNVTGIRTPYREMARMIHEAGGVVFVDFAASAPYDPIDMHPGGEGEDLDAIFFSPHKFLGGPGSSGVLVFNSSLYKNKVPDQPGGGTVNWTNPWGDYRFIDDIEIREDGGTPGFLQAIKASLAMELKEQMGIDHIHRRENEIVKLAFQEFTKIPELYILAEDTRDRLPVFSFFITDIHYNLVVRLLNDRFGVQARGGCACAGTYGHLLLDLTFDQSQRIADLVIHGDLSEKPGWARISFHPTTTDDQVLFIADALRQIQKNYKVWEKDYQYDRRTNEFFYKEADYGQLRFHDWFRL